MQPASRRLLIRVGRRKPIPPAPLKIASIGAFGLFGKLNYPHIPISFDSDNSNRISVLYGDNGTGKTTILRLIYNCLSPQINEGARTFVSKTAFREFFVNFSDGTCIRTVKLNGLIGDFEVFVSKKNSSESFVVRADAEGNIRDQESVDKLCQFLAELNFDLIFVDHKRIVKSTYEFIEENDTESASKSDVEYKKSPKLLYNSISFALEKHAEDLEYTMPKVVDALNRKLRIQAYRQGAAGDQDAAAVYLEIAKSISRPRNSSQSIPETVSVINLLTDLKSRTHTFIEQGLLSKYPFDEFIAIYNTSSKSKRGQIENILSPFLDSIQRKINALNDIHHTITVFINEISKYFYKKTVSFSILDGLNISDETGPIELNELSSGEKQLIFLLCSAVISKSKRGIIIIDEPEISLNYKWQRLIAGSLATLSAGGETQYLLASHSIEIITQHVASSFELMP